MQNITIVYLSTNFFLSLSTTHPLMSESTKKNYTINNSNNDAISNIYTPETPYYQLRLESLELFERIKQASRDEYPPLFDKLTIENIMNLIR